MVAAGVGCCIWRPGSASVTLTLFLLASNLPGRLVPDATITPSFLWGKPNLDFSPNKNAQPWEWCLPRLISHSHLRTNEFIQINSRVYLVSGPLLGLKGGDKSWFQECCLLTPTPCS